MRGAGPLPCERVLMEHARKTGALRGATWRAVILGLLLIIPQAYFSLYGFTWGQSHPATVSLYFNVVVTIFLLVLVNGLLRRFAPRLALGHGELIVIYGMLTVVTALYGHDQLHNMVPVVAYPAWHATPENRWETLFVGDIANWLTVKDPRALRAYFDAREPMLASPYWRPWATPALAWAGFMLVMTWVFLCINVLLRRQWTEESKLSFPIVQLPLELTSPKSGLLRAKLFWIGFGVAFAIDIVNGLHVLYPSVPSILGQYAGQYDLGRQLRTMPWRAIGWTPMAVFPFAIGLAFFIPLDLAFSSWFFYIFWKSVRIVTAALGIQQLPRAPWIDEQNFAGYLVLAGASLWTTRKHLNAALRSAFGGARIGDEGEPLPYRWAVWGGIAGIAALIVFCTQAGMSFPGAAVWLAIYLAISVGVARIRAELGSPVHDLHFMGPEVALVEAGGAEVWGKKSLIMYSFFFAFTRAHRSHPMPTQIEAMKLASETGINQQGLSGALMLAAGVGLVIGWYVMLDAFFRYGGQPSYPGRGAWDRLQSWLEAPAGTNWYAVTAMAIGGIATLGLTAVRSRYAWFPFHPAGFAVSGTWSMALFAPSILVSWLAKAVILRYGGMSSFRPASTFFMGLIMGEFLAGAWWGTYGIITHRRMYNFLP